MDIKRLRHTAVVTIQGGERLGAITDVHVDLDKRAISAVVVHMEGRSGSSAAIVPREAIRAIGTDAVMVEDRAAVQLEPSPIDTTAYPDLKRLTSLKVVTDQGTHEGSVETVDIDEQTGKLTDVRVTPPGVRRLWRKHRIVPIGEVISMGRDLVVIPEQMDTGGVPTAQADQSEQADQG